MVQAGRQTGGEGMSKTILADVDGFTPCIDILTQQYGVITSAVFGKVWRYCQGERGVCQAAIETIANDLKLSYRTVLRHVKLLAKDGYLEDLTPDLRNVPHTYRETGKVQLSLLIKSGMTESHTGMTLSQSAMTLSQSHSDLESHEDSIKDSIKILDSDSKSLSMTGGQKQFLACFDAKRFSKTIQRDTVLALEKEYGTDKLIEFARWAAKKGLGMGTAIGAAEKTLKKWGVPRAPAGANGSQITANEDGSYYV
jgi:hypothetical protein